MKLAVIDIETTGLLNENPHVLEIAACVLDAEDPSLPTVVPTKSWLVLPPHFDHINKREHLRTFDDDFLVADNPRSLRVKNPFVHDMHTKNGLLPELRVALEDVDYRRCLPDLVERELCQMLAPYKSDTLLFTGNSIANLDIPVLRKYMPRLMDLLHYRILDVSVLRTFYTQVAKVSLPDEIAVAINKGVLVGQDPKEAKHRAADDVDACVSALRAITGWARSR